MTDEDMTILVARLEERWKASEKALDVAQKVLEHTDVTKHAVRAEVISVVAILTSLYAIFRK
jgi:hypothetical protein